MQLNGSSFTVRLALGIFTLPNEPHNRFSCEPKAEYSTISPNPSTSLEQSPSTLPKRCPHRIEPSLTDKMSEAPTTNGSPSTDDFDLVAARSALYSSSTTARISHLRLIDEKLAQNGTTAPAYAPEPLLPRTIF